MPDELKQVVPGKIYKVEEYFQDEYKIQVLTCQDTKDAFFFGVAAGVVMTPQGPRPGNVPFPIEAKDLSDAFAAFPHAFEKFRAMAQRNIAVAPAGALPPPPGARKGGNGPSPGGSIQMAR